MKVFGYRIFALPTLLALSISSCLEAAEFVIGDLMGQLGNQLFIIAATVSLALDHNATPSFPALLSNTDFNIPINREKIFKHFNVDALLQDVQYCYIEPHFHYTPILYRPNMLIRGWFQSEKYFRHHRQEILELFKPSNAIVDYLTEKYAAIIESPKTVSIHFRSYHKEDPTHQVYAECGLDYFKSALALFPEDTLFVVFSNEMEWCKRHFSALPRTFYFVEGETHYHDLYLMSMCKHHIISNSSFSWWGAYLNRHPDKRVIAPAVWFNPAYCQDSYDLLPPEWLVL